MASWFGVVLRSPRKQDFAYNVAFSGHRCAHLTLPRGQVTQLEDELRRDPSAWSESVAVIRIGINDLGTQSRLRLVANADSNPEAARALQECLRDIAVAVDRLHATVPTLRVVLAGIADNTGWPPLHGAFQSEVEILRLERYHDAFDDGLRDIAAQRSRVAFLDERALFRRYWGSRSATGVPEYRSVHIGGLSVTPTQGDGIEHMTLADGHAGTVANTLWAKTLVDVLIDSLDVEMPRVTVAELEAFLRGL
ncbi:MAG: SGNH/GDSL hydrolase family protein [Gemmatimonadaceae bacterium]|nr:SGNH/GDSL hydrolase family protein [Gemmatimonadaceae bacterium]